MDPTRGPSANRPAKSARSGTAGQGYLGDVKGFAVRSHWTALCPPVRPTNARTCGWAEYPRSGPYVSSTPGGTVSKHLHTSWPWHIAVAARRAHYSGKTPPPSGSLGDGVTVSHQPREPRRSVISGDPPRPGGARGKPVTCPLLGTGSAAQPSSRPARKDWLRSPKMDSRATKLWGGMSLVAMRPAGPLCRVFRMPLDRRWRQMDHRDARGSQGLGGSL